MMPVFIVFEGGDGSGKSTQMRFLYNLLRRQGTAVKLAHEPGSTPLGESIRRLLAARRKFPVHGDVASPISPEAELFLFEASRAQLVAEVIQPSLSGGVSVLCDRYMYSTVAYQGYGRGLDLKAVERLNKMATGGLQPDLVIFLDLPPEAALQRKATTTDMGRFEKEKMDFHRRVREGYLKQAAADTGRWFIVDALLPRAEISRAISARVQKLLKKKPAPGG